LQFDDRIDQIAAIPISAASTRLSIMPVPIVTPMIAASIRTRRKDVAGM
jgi:hypothetical protein